MQSERNALDRLAAVVCGLLCGTIAERSCASAAGVWKEAFLPADGSEHLLIPFLGPGERSEGMQLVVTIYSDVAPQQPHSPSARGDDWSKCWCCSRSRTHPCFASVVLSLSHPLLFSHPQPHSQHKCSHPQSHHKCDVPGAKSAAGIRVLTN